METKFYVGQMVMGQEGQVVIVLDPNHGSHTFKGVLVYGQTEKQPIGHISSKWAKECFVSFPIDPPRVVLTEWQEKRISSVLNQLVCDDYTEKGALEAIKSIISEPEPPKYQPKQGEAVVFRDRNDCPWSASVATGIYWRIYYYGDTLDAFEVRPFDASLIGKVTND